MRKQSWQRQYFRSYLLIGVVPIALFALIFAYTSATSYKTEIESSHYASFAQFASTMDNLLGQMGLIANHMSDSDLDYRALADDTASTHQQEVDEAVQKLIIYEDQVPWNVRTALFVRGTPYVCTTDGLISYQDFQRTASVYGNLDYSGFFTAISTISRPTARRLVSALGTEEQRAGNAMVVMYPLPSMEAIPQATLCFFVGEDVVSGMVDNCVTGLPGSLYVFSNIYYEAMRCAVNGFIGAAPDVSRVLGTGIIPLDQESGRYVVMRSVLQNNSLSLSLVSDRNVFYNRLGSLWKVFCAAALVILGLSVIGAMLMTRRSYSPLRRLLGGIGVGDGQTRFSNEFDLIQRHMDFTAQRNSELDQQLARQRPMVMEACLSKLLLGKFASRAEMEFQLRCAGMDVSRQRTFALLVYAQGDDASSGEQCLEHLRGLFHAPLPGGGQAYALEEEVDGLLAIMVACPPEKQPGDDPREAIARVILDQAQAPGPVRMMAGAGSLCDDPMRLHDSCMEALAVVREYLPGAGVPFACYDQIEHVPQHLSLPTLDCALLNQSLKQGDAQMARKTLEKIFNEINRTESLLFVQCMCYDVVNNMLRTIQTLQPQYNPQQLHALCAFRSADEFYRAATQLIDDFCTQYNEVRETRTSRMREELIGFVADHVFSYDLSLEQIANEFHLSLSNLSRFFKQETGCTFSQYVTLMRFDKAKRLLAETDMPIKDIVTQVGYIDTASFVRKFKAYEGLTPGQWRNAYRIPR